jgi:hypothetical protein
VVVIVPVPLAHRDPDGYEASNALRVVPPPQRARFPGRLQRLEVFVQSFALALREELKDTVSVTSLMPGPTETELFERADILDTKVGADDKDDPADVARDGIEALMSGKDRVVSASTKTKLQGRAGRVLPDRAMAAMHGSMAEPGSADDD